MTSRHGLLTTIAWNLDGQVAYALEGSIFTAGAVVQWLRDEMGLIETAAQSAEMAARVEDTHGVYLVPAFNGLGAPYWDMHARGAILGLTRGVRREHIVRAALEAIAYQTRDVIDAMQEDSGVVLKHLQVDGGAAVNSFLMQFQADILGVPVRRPEMLETTAMGAAFLAGLAVGFWRDRAEIREIIRRGDTVFSPVRADIRRRELYHGWLQAVQTACSQSSVGSSCCGKPGFSPDDTEVVPPLS